MIALLLLNTFISLVVSQELGILYMRLEGMRERCLVEELPENTVALVKHAGQLWDTERNMPAPDQNFQLLITVRDSKGHTVTRQQSKPEGRVFLTAATTGEHLICFQSLLSNFQPNMVVKLPVEVFIGDAGDPHITSPIEAKLHDLSYNIGKGNELVADIERELALQRDRETHFRQKSEALHRQTFRWPIIQAIVLIGTAFWQMYHLKNFFKAKKLV